MGTFAPGLRVNFFPVLEGSSASLFDELWFKSLAAPWLPSEASFLSGFVSCASAGGLLAPSLSFSGCRGEIRDRELISCCILRASDFVEERADLRGVWEGEMKGEFVLELDDCPSCFVDTAESKQDSLLQEHGR